MKRSITSAVLAALPLQAEELQFDLTGQASDSPQVLRGAPGTPFSASFTLDTTSGDTSILFTDATDATSPFRTPSSDVQELINHGALLSDASLLVNGQSLVAAPSLTGSYAFSRRLCPGDLCSVKDPFRGYGSVDWWIDPQTFLVWQNIPTNSELDVGRFPTVGQQSSQATLYHSDGGAFSVVDYLDVTSVNEEERRPVRSVPEPSTLWLLVLGLALVFALRAKSA
jgi:hypothetical protein